MRGRHHFRYGAIAAGGEHQMKVAPREGRADRLDIEAGGSLQNHGLPAELPG